MHLLIATPSNSFPSLTLGLYTVTVISLFLIIQTYMYMYLEYRGRGGVSEICTVASR